MNQAIHLAKNIFLALVVIFTGCASVPKEVVELSYAVGQDLNSVHSSYQELIHVHFDGLRTQANTVIDTKWTPNFLNDFIKKGDLIQSAEGSDPEKVLEDVQDWVEVAIEKIESKRKEIIDPINKDEAALLNSVDEAFTRLITANATITAHLNSLRKVQEVQDEALQALNLKDLKEKVNKALITASNNTQEALEKLEKTENQIKPFEK